MKRSRVTSLALLPLILGMILLAGCKGSAGPEALSPSTRPGETELHDFLMAELSRLGKDPSRSTSAVATGNDNRVFDLRPTLIDPDGPGGDPPVAVTLSWSEVLVGDYDQNGLVNASDLTPLGQNYLKSVEYDDAGLHGGFASWPVGDPLDDGGVSPPASGSPAANWRLARIDGDRNGLLNQADITSIAVHWQEALSGYRIYRQAPGETEFTILPGQAGTSDGLSVNHPTTPGNAPVLYGFEDDNTSASGIYLYYVAPYDLQSQEQGPASGIVSIDLDTGTVNSSPVANLSVTPDFAGAPAEITLDASGSYDPDGSIAAYEWDFDGDGTTDWLSTDPLPETSSDGTVDSFEEVESGVVKATYRQGSDDYFQPSVRAVDDLAVSSNLASTQLGISGWIYEDLHVSGQHIIDFGPASDYPGSISVDPVSGQVVIIGQNEGSESQQGNPEAPRGVYVAWREGPGIWRQELVVDYSSPQWKISESQTYGITNSEQIFWLNDTPVALFYSQAGGSVYSWMAQRSPNGNWSLVRVTEAGFWIDRGSQVNSQRIAINVAQGGAGGSPIDWWILDITPAGWELKPTGLHTSFNPPSELGRPQGITESSGELAVVVTFDTSDRTGLYWLRESIEEESWQKELVLSSVKGTSVFNGCDSVVLSDTRKVHSIYRVSEYGDPNPPDLELLVEENEQTKVFVMRESISRYKTNFLWTDSTSSAVFSLQLRTNPESDNTSNVFYDRLENGKHISETVISRKREEPDNFSAGFSCGVTADSGKAYAVISASSSADGKTTLLASRVDPRFEP